jgi:hypothetical protein
MKPSWSLEMREEIAEMKAEMKKLAQLEAKLLF